MESTKQQEIDETVELLKGDPETILEPDAFPEHLSEKENKQVFPQQERDPGVVFDASSFFKKLSLFMFCIMLCTLLGVFFIMKTYQGAPIESGDSDRVLEYLVKLEPIVKNIQSDILILKGSAEEKTTDLNTAGLDDQITGINSKLIGLSKQLSDIKFSVGEHRVNAAKQFKKMSDISNVIDDKISDMTTKKEAPANVEPISVEQKGYRYKFNNVKEQSN